MNPILNYPIPEGRRDFEVVFLFGTICLMVIVATLYFAFYFSMSKISGSAGEPEVNPENEYTITV